MLRLLHPVWSVGIVAGSCLVLQHTMGRLQAWQFPLHFLASGLAHCVLSLLPQLLCAAYTQWFEHFVDSNSRAKCSHNVWGHLDGTHFSSEHSALS